MVDTLWRTLWKKPLHKRLGTLWSHWWAHCERTQHVPTGDIVIPSLGTLWMWSPCPHWTHCNQIDGNIVNVITMYPLGTLESHGWVHLKCGQHLPAGHIKFTWLGTFWMYLIFAHWTHHDPLLTGFSMYSACAHWLLGSLPPMLATSLILSTMGWYLGKSSTIVRPILSTLTWGLIASKTLLELTMPSSLVAGVL